MAYDPECIACHKLLDDSGLCSDCQSECVAGWQENCRKIEEQSRTLQAELGALREYRNHMAGYVVGLQRHAMAMTERDPMIFLPAPVAAIIGHMHRETRKAVEQAKGD